MDDILMQSLETVSDLLREQKITSRELTQQCLDRIEMLQKKVNAFVYVDADNALAAAVKADQEIRSGKYRGRLHGIPIGLKDLYYTKDIPTTAGSRILKDFIPTFNGTVVERMLEAGAILLGKTNTQEFAIGPTTEDSIFGPTRNPWNSRKIPGGSSGGSGAAVAAGMAYVAMGTDTGGSIRIPASMCGTVGYKPTYGLNSLYGIVPMCLSMDHAGPLTRSVADAAIVTDITSGTDPKDPAYGAIDAPPTRFYDSIKNIKDLKGKCIGIPTNFFLEKTETEVERLFFKAAEKLQILGAKLVYVEIPLLEYLDETGDCIVFSGTTYSHKDTYPSRKDEYSEFVASRLAAGENCSAIQYIEAEERRRQMKIAWEGLLSEQGLDAVIVPTCPNVAYDIGLKSPWLIQVKGRDEPGRAMCSRHTRLASLLGCPALSIPAGLTSEGLPAGLMIMGKKYEDSKVLSIGLAYERNYPFLCCEISRTE